MCVCEREREYLRCHESNSSLHVLELSLSSCVTGQTSSCSEISDSNSLASGVQQNVATCVCVCVCVCV